MLTRNEATNHITLGINNLEKSLQFYQDGLGWETKGICRTQFENGAIVVFSRPRYKALM